MSDELSFPMTEADLELASLARGMIRGYLDDRNLPAEDIVDREEPITFYAKGHQRGTKQALIYGI